MIKNYIAENISFLIRKSRCSQDEFGALFDLNRGNVNQYIKEKAQPKIETLQKIASHFDVLIDDLINRPLTEEILRKKYSQADQLNSVAEPEIVELLRQNLADKEKIINAYELELNQYRKPKSSSKKNAG